MSDTPAPQLSDWPPKYIAELRDSEGWADKSDDFMLAILMRDHAAMRFGKVIDFDHGFYLHHGNGRVTKSTGHHKPYLVAALGMTTIDVAVSGDVRLCDAQVDGVDVRDGTEMLEWLIRHAKSSWMLTTEFSEGKWESHWWLNLHLLGGEDEVAFLTEFPDMGDEA